jgi:hypothetical protein
VRGSGEHRNRNCSLALLFNEDGGRGYCKKVIAAYGRSERSLNFTLADLP